MSLIDDGPVYTGSSMGPMVNMRSPGMSPHQRRKMWALAGELGLTEQEVRDLVERLFTHAENGSTARLSAVEGRRICDQLEGARTVLALYSLR